MWLFLAFLMIPLIEIALFIQIGGAIGLIPTLAIVVLTAILGTYLVRNQGLLAMSQIRSSFNELNDPTEPIVHGAMILFSGALLLTPGFFTDAIGFALLVPQVRSAAFHWLRKRVNVQSFGTPHAQQHHQTTIIEGEFQEVDPNQKTKDGPSGWTKH